MSEKRIGIIMHGVTGRMGTNQHLVRSILEIRKQGGVALANGERLSQCSSHRLFAIHVLVGGDGTLQEFRPQLRRCRVEEDLIARILERTVQIGGPALDTMRPC